MKSTQADKLVAGCAKMAAKATKIEAYVIVYETKKGAVHTVRAGSVTSQAGLLKVASQAVMRSFEPVKP